jgi:adenine-specific DNA methylase/very-short-patch-repair endonuclease
MTYRKKLIEVALPLEAINMESAREKSIRHGHPSTLHLWWSRKPTATARAVLWASLVDDPSSWPDKFPTEEDQKRERQRLFDILGRIVIEVDKKGNQKQVVRGLVSWDEVNDPKSKALEAAQWEIARCLAWDRGEEPPTKPDAVREYIAKYAPPAYDPFAGGGSIPLEAQRLGLQAHASDLNPVAVLINKALIEIPPKFKDRVPVNPVDGPHPPAPSPRGRGGIAGLNRWYGAQGLAADVRFYGAWMRERAFERIGHLYPKVKAIRLADGSYQPWSPPHPPAPSPTGGEGEQERWEISDALSKKMTEVARQLRKQETQSEEILWQALRGAKLEGRKFRRQHPIGCFVVDFFCAAERLIVEVDGAVHDSQQELDRERQMLLESLGLRFLRLSAHAVETDLSTCLKQIEAAFTLHSPGFSPLSPRGRGAGGEGAKAEELTVIAWLWARTVKCPNPACGCQMPLVQSFQLSTKKGKEAWVEPVIERIDALTPQPPLPRGEGEPENLSASSSPRPLGEGPGVRVKFVVKSGQGQAPEGTVDRKGARCIACGAPVPLEYVRQEGRAGRMGAQLMAIVAEGQNGRVYLSPQQEHVEVAESAQPTWKPEADLPHNPRDFKTPNYGMKKISDLFTPRQLVALTTFSDLVAEAREKATQDAVAAGLADDDLPLAEGGTGARAYGDAIATYLAFVLSKVEDRGSTLGRWDPTPTQSGVINTFSRQALPMTWDYAEPNPLGDASGSFTGSISWVIKVLENHSGRVNAKVYQHDATDPHPNDTTSKLISTDPPYYDNIGYADLSDFFYVWLRRSLGSIYPNICSTLLVPKAQELVATPYRFEGSKQKAQTFFEEGLGKAFNRMHEISHADYPLTVYYAFKQAETDQKGKSDESVASTGWETMLEGLIKADFSINGTWPMRSELSNRMVASGTNALASSIVLVCRPRPTNAPKITRRQFLTELKRELPQALKTLQQGNVAPVDLAQASIGPGMAVFSQYAAVLENDGSPMRVRTALQLINQILDEFLTEQEGEFDGDTRWALTWFEQYQFEPGQYGFAETLSKAKNTSVQGMVEAGILEAKGGKVRLLKRSELKSDWNPNSDNRMPDWEIAQYLIHELDRKGEMGAAELLANLGNRTARACRHTQCAT